jgi:hypothetical protein
MHGAEAESMLLAAIDPITRKVHLSRRRFSEVRVQRSISKIGDLSKEMAWSRGQAQKQVSVSRKSLGAMEHATAALMTNITVVVCKFKKVMSIRRTLVQGAANTPGPGRREFCWSCRRDA